tara:strand:- start:191 stop:496 length:306 start_codon:yes stop_codon:yes gene_type:complete
MGPIMENLKDHLAFQIEIEKKGIMFAAGPHREKDKENDEDSWAGEGMIIIRADSLEEATKIAESDPMHSSGARSFIIKPWLMNEGKLSIEIDFSDREVKVM